MHFIKNSLTPLLNSFTQKLKKLTLFLKYLTLERRIPCFNLIKSSTQKRFYLHNLKKSCNFAVKWIKYIVYSLTFFKIVNMKKLFIIPILLLNILPAFAYVRDDTNTGWGPIGTIIFFAILIIVFIAQLKNGDNK